MLTALDESAATSVASCSVEGCDQGPRLRGLCAKHYQRKWHTGEIEVVRDDRDLPCASDRCSNLISARAKSGLCHRCRRKREKAAYRKRVPHDVGRYGISPTQYLEMFEAQGGVCAICSNPETDRMPSGKLKRLAVDHDHETGVVRALLCRSCNVGIGMFAEDLDRMLAAAAYLESHKLSSS